MTGKPITAEQKEYIRGHFTETPTKELMAVLGLSHGCIMSNARKMGLRRSSEHLHKMRHESGLASAKSRGGKGVALTPDMIRRRVESRHKTFLMERARKQWGLDQLTKLHVTRRPATKLRQSLYLKSLGYIVDDYNCVAYWKEDTKRAVRIEAAPRRYFTFEPLKENKPQEQYAG